MVPERNRRERLEDQGGGGKSGQPTGEFVASIAQRFIDIFKAYAISYDDFVRTTEPRHVKASQALFTKLQANGFIYEGLYEGWYDVSAETFFKDDELVDGNRRTATTSGG
jgi:methionyl-tRNA synthetase